jgi:cytochrome c-type biogenesis protein CcmE
MRNPKFLVGGLLILAAIVYLIISSSQASAQYYVTIDELRARSAELAGRELRVSGAVIGDSIKYDANIPSDNKVIDASGGLAAVLKAAVVDNSLARVNVVYKGVKPDLLKNEAQAIMTGKYEANGTFTATELLLKCPTKYEEAVPEQSQ